MTPSRERRAEEPASPAEVDPYDRREVLVAWLSANDVDPRNVPRDSDLTISTEPDGTQTLHYEACVLTPDGHRMLNERRDGAAVERRTAPLKVPPPDWFVPFEKPTRENLLDVIERCRALITAGPSSDAADRGEYESGWNAAMTVVKGALDDVKART